MWPADSIPLGYMVKATPPKGQHSGVNVPFHAPQPLLWNLSLVSHPHQNSHCPSEHQACQATEPSLIFFSLSGMFFSSSPGATRSPSQTCPNDYTSWLSSVSPILGQKNWSCSILFQFFMSCLPLSGWKLVTINNSDKHGADWWWW